MRNLDHLEGKVAALDMLMCFTWFILLSEMEDEQRTTLTTRLKRITRWDFKDSHNYSADYIKGYKDIMDGFSDFALDEWLPPPIKDKDS